MRIFKVLCVAAATFLPLSSLADETLAGGKLVVTGQGSVATRPDMALITLGAVAENAEAGVAMREMSERIAAIHQRLEAAGIAPLDIQTGQLSLVPRRAESKSLGGQGEIEAFVAASDVTVRIRDLEALGPLLDTVVADGANTLRGLRFDLQEPGPVEDDARRAAVADARRKAALLAEAAGVGLGAILTIEENGMGGGVPMRMASAMREGMPIAPGEMEIEAMVTITWALDQ